MLITENTVALVTGGASGIGEAVARRLAGAGAKVAVVDRDAAAATRVADELRGLAVACDVTSDTAMGAAVAEAETWGGRLDVVHLNAGSVGGQSGITDLDVAAYRRVVGVNVDHVVFGLTAAVPALRRAGGGTVIATSSLAGLVPLPGDAIYTLTKHAVVGYVRSAAATLATEDIRVMALCPGFADTALIAHLREQFAGFPLLTAEDVADGVERMLADGAPGECWYVQPGREPGPYGFRGVPGPKGGEAPPRLAWEG
ncbi:SDR family oxidoreductase [Actinomycetospora sp. TBRC 11914]|uniref:SDR family oxidoreductase n=1 Tax=Actinomycetospora sp. TBRC 11914 TaxID=2729387 RepID=UPI00145F29AF|nr:SDR family NAD(P)-dependent oxidoreductase [Actinomycetospora sp. TBRC 11914]NMO92814.1 SDR family NAD(P)-dependent oxidoreductase [Actinomycetospora sp. TBRC 11914]